MRQRQCEMMQLLRFNETRCRRERERGSRMRMRRGNDDGEMWGWGKIIYREQTKLESHDVATSRCDINHLIVRSTEGPKSLTQNNDDNRGGGCRKYRCSNVNKVQ